MLTEELAAAFAGIGITVRIRDYRRQPRDVLNALNDPACRFALCFDGFGSELLVASRKPGGFRSTFEYTHTPLFDLMHACPAHDGMAHQVDSRFGLRTPLLTDFASVSFAKSMGFRAARFVPSIACTVDPLPWAQREGVLLPLVFISAEDVRKRHTNASYRSRVWREVFEGVVAAAARDLRLDPVQEVVTACQQAGLVFNPAEADSRFLLSTVVDCVAAERQLALVRALADCPVTLVAPAVPDGVLDGTNLRHVPMPGRAELLRMMAAAQAVISGVAPMTGFDPIAMDALAAGALLLSAPNNAMETTLQHGRDLLIHQSEVQLALTIAQLATDPAPFGAVAARGQAAVQCHFPPRRLAEAILALYRQERTHYIPGSPGGLSGPEQRPA